MGGQGAWLDPVWDEWGRWGGWLGGALWAQFGGEWAGSVEQRSGLGVPSSPVLVGVGSYWGIFFNV